MQNVWLQNYHWLCFQPQSVLADPLVKALHTLKCTMSQHVECIVCHLRESVKALVTRHMSRAIAVDTGRDHLFYLSDYCAWLFDVKNLLYEEQSTIMFLLYIFLAELAYQNCETSRQIQRQQDILTNITETSIVWSTKLTTSEAYLHVSSQDQNCWVGNIDKTSIVGLINLYATCYFHLLYYLPGYCKFESIWWFNNKARDETPYWPQKYSFLCIRCSYVLQHYFLRSIPWYLRSRRESQQRLLGWWWWLRSCWFHSR